jgi:hypothetical protein
MRHEQASPMLSLRLVIFAALSGVALWGLFSLLENLREPELLRSAKAVVVKGCEPMESADAQRLCPQLFCQKFLLDQRALPRNAQFEVTIDSVGGAQRLIGGAARSSAPATELRFACIVEGTKVAAGRVIDAARLDTLATQPGGWNLGE